MKKLILIWLKRKHLIALDRFHRSKYSDRMYERYLWTKVLDWRRRIRRHEPEFLIGFDEYSDHVWGIWNVIKPTMIQSDPQKPNEQNNIPRGL